MYKGKGKGKGFQGKCWLCNRVGHTAAECKGKGKGGKAGKGAYSLDEGNSMNWASNEDYTAAWGNQSEGQDTGYTIGHISSPIWTMSLRQAKKLTPMNKAVLPKEAREQDCNRGQFSALSVGATGVPADVGMFTLASIMRLP